MIETSRAFGKGNGLIGTITLPTNAAAPAAVGLVLFNAGVVHRVGVHRTNVKLARQLALAGVASIRFDLAGVGDSARESEAHSFTEQAVVDLRAAMDVLAEHVGVRRFVLFGACSGAVHGHATALVDDRIVGLAMFDTFKYSTMKARLRYFALRLKKLNAPRIVVARAAQLGVKAARRMLQIVGAPKPPAQASNVGFFSSRPSKTEFAAGLRTLLDRDVRVLLIYAGSGFVHYNYENQFADAFKGLGVSERATVKFLRDIDHTATRIAAQQELIACVEAWVKPIAWAAQPPAGVVPRN